MKKIIWLYPKLEKWMGGTRYVFECSKQLSKKYDITVICQKSNTLISDEFKKNNISLIDLQSNSFTDLNFWLFFKRNINRDLKKIKKLISKDEIVISSMFPMNLLADKLSNKHIQIVYEPFSFFYYKYIWKDFSVLHHIFFKIMSFLYSSFDITATQNANKLLTLSKYEAINIKKIYNVNSEVIYEGVDLDFFSIKDSTSLQLKYPDCFPIMHSTGFDSYKGTDLVIKSLPLLKKEISNFKIFITFTRENSKKLSSYKKFIRKNKLKENVVFLGSIPYRLLPELYSFVKVYLEPGIGRSMSLSNKEAMACGTPVIVGLDASEEVKDGFNGFLIDHSSIEQLVSKIKIIYNSDNFYSNNALDFVEKRFSWESVSEKICHQIENLSIK